MLCRAMAKGKRSIIIPPGARTIQAYLHQLSSAALLLRDEIDCLRVRAHDAGRHRQLNLFHAGNHGTKPPLSLALD